LTNRWYREIGNAIGFLGLMGRGVSRQDDTGDVKKSNW